MGKGKKFRLVMTMNKFKQYEQILIFDFETTGLDYKNDDVIELGGLLLKNKNGKFEIVETLNLLVKTDKPLRPVIIGLTGITDEILQKNGVDRKVLFDTLKRIYDVPSTLFMAYNIQFDITFLNNLFIRYGFKEDFIFDRDVLDVMAMYRDFFGYPHKLDAAVASLEVEHENTHRASDDCMATWIAFQKMVKDYTEKRIDPYINKIGYIAKWGVNGIRMPQVKYISQRGSGKEIINYAE